jgi:hypothetical protein
MVEPRLWWKWHIALIACDFWIAWIRILVHQLHEVILITVNLWLSLSISLWWNLFIGGSCDDFTFHWCVSIINSIALLRSGDTTNDTEETAAEEEDDNSSSTPLGTSNHTLLSTCLTVSNIIPMGKSILGVIKVSS